MQLVKQTDETAERKAHDGMSGGLAGWLLAAFARVAVGGWKSRASTKQRELKLVETLSLGGRRQLMLVSCAGEQFLVGAGADSISSVIHLSGQKQHRAGSGTKKLAEPWA